MVFHRLCVTKNQAFEFSKFLFMTVIRLFVIRLNAAEVWDAEQCEELGPAFFLAAFSVTAFVNLHC
jgi:hypothetical protein